MKINRDANKAKYKNNKKYRYLVEIIAILLLALATDLYLTAETLAQQEQFQTEEYVKATHRSWQVKCQRSYKEDDVLEECFMLQENADRNNPMITSIILILQSTPGNYLIRITVPLGVFLPKGLTLSIDDKHIGRVGYLYCYSGGCVSESALPQTLVEKFKSGNAGSLIFHDLNNQKLEMPLSLSGFTKAYETLLNGQ